MLCLIVFVLFVVVGCGLLVVRSWLRLRLLCEVLSLCGVLLRVVVCCSVLSCMWLWVYVS